MTAPDTVIETVNLEKRYRMVEAVRGLNLVVPRGSICGFLGRNGAGKTTTIKMLMGMLKPSGGMGRVFGLAINHPEESVRIRQRTGFVSEDKDLAPFLSVDQILAITRGFYPTWRADLEEKYLRRFELKRTAYPSKLSRGNRTKLALLLAIARGAELLILDEPTSGLDPAMIEEVLQILVSLNAGDGTTIFFSSHQLSEIEQIADRVAIIDRGRTVIEESLDELKANYRRVRVVLEDESLELPVVAGAGSVKRQGRSVSMLVNGAAEAAVEQAWACGAVSVDVEPVTLKEIFLDCTGRGEDVDALA